VFRYSIVSGDVMHAAEAGSRKGNARSLAIAPPLLVLILLAQSACGGGGSADVQTSPHSATLTWAASVTANVTYNVYRGSTSGGEDMTTPINPSAISALSYTDSNVTAGSQYFYVVEAVDGSGNSVPSNEVMATIPTP
jgi:hypothetical protein